MSEFYFSTQSENIASGGESKEKDKNKFKPPISKNTKSNNSERTGRLSSSRENSLRNNINFNVNALKIKNVDLKMYINFNNEPNKDGKIKDFKSNSHNVTKRCESSGIRINSSNKKTLEDLSVEKDKLKITKFNISDRNENKGDKINKKICSSNIVKKVSIHDIKKILDDNSRNYLHFSYDEFLKGEDKVRSNEESSLSEVHSILNN